LIFHPDTSATPLLICTGWENAQFGLNFRHHSTSIGRVLKSASRINSPNGEDGPMSSLTAHKNCTCVYTAVVSADAWHLDVLVVHDVGSFLGVTDGQAAVKSCNVCLTMLSSVVLYAGVQGKRTDSRKRS